jgi:hypothetical protein
MKFKELSGIWNSTDLELEKSVQINKELVMSISLSKIKSRLYEIKWTGIIEIVVGFIFFNFLVRFIGAHFTDFRFYFPALILLAITVFSLIFEIYRMSLFYTIDSKAAVIEAQKKLAKLKKLEILDIHSLIIIIPLFSAPFLIVAAKAFLNLSLYGAYSTWLVYLSAGSILIAAILIFILKRFPNKNLQESIAFLNELKENEN